MTVVTSHYHALQCNARIDNIVTPVCGAKSPGAWEDAEEMERVALLRGWTKTAKGHNCPACSAAAAGRDGEAVGEVTKPVRRGKPKVTAVPDQDWPQPEAVNQ